MTRTIESHESTVRYFRTLGWTIDYDMYFRFDEDSSERDCFFTAFVCRSSSEEYDFVSNFNTYNEMITSVSEWLVDTAQGGDNHTEQALETL